MLLPERRAEIMRILRERQTASVAELSARLYISETSVRRDLAELERGGLIKRTYGGAMLISGENEVLSLDARIETGKEAKSVIARKAVGLIRDSSVIFLDSSSTALAMTPLFERFSSLTVITNGARIALLLAECSKARVYSTGGLMTPGIYSYSGSMAREAIGGFCADVAFISPKALHPQRGAFCASEEEAAVRRAMIERSRRTILLCHSDKLGRAAPFHMCEYSKIDAVVLDRAPDEEWLNIFSANGIERI